MKYLTTILLLALLASCASIRFADLTGQWELNGRLSDVVPTATSEGVDLKDTAIAVPLRLNIYLVDDRATITTRDSQDSVVVAHYRYDAESNQLTPMAGNPRTYLIDARKHRIVLTDVEGHRLVFTKANMQL